MACSLEVRPYEEPIITFRIMLRGYREAVDRFRIAAATMDPEPGVVALFETLNWAVALDERCGKHWAPDGVPLGSKWLERWSGDVAIARGIRFVRNRAHHQWAEALMLHFANVRTDGPHDEFEWRWRPAAELPSAPPERADRRGEKAYEELLAGRTAETTLSSVEALYSNLANLLEPRLGRSRAGEALS